MTMRSARTPLNAFDHPMVAMRDLGEVRETWERLGFRVTPFRAHEIMGGGKAGGKGGNHIVMLTPQCPGSANMIELAYCDPLHAAPAMRSILVRPPGLALMSVNSLDARASGEEWQNDGCKFEPFAVDFNWKDPETDRTDRIAFTASVPVSWPWSLYTGPITYHSLDYYTRADLQVHPNTAVSWRTITVAVTSKDLQAGEELLTKTYGLAPSIGEGSVEWVCGPTSFRLLLRDAFEREYLVEADPNSIEAPNTAILIKVGDIAVARKVLRANGVHMREKAGRIVVPASQANGIIVELAES